MKLTLKRFVKTQNETWLDKEYALALHFLWWFVCVYMSVCESVCVVCVRARDREREREGGREERDALFFPVKMRSVYNARKW